MCDISEKGKHVVMAQVNWALIKVLKIHYCYRSFEKALKLFSEVEFPCNQGTKIGVPKVFRRIPKNSSTNICGVPRNSDSYPPNTLAIRDCCKGKINSMNVRLNVCHKNYFHKYHDFVINYFKLTLFLSFLIEFNIVNKLSNASQVDLNCFMYFSFQF